MHNANFQALGLPFVYDALDSPDIAAVAAALKNPSFHGGSVTMPHKQAVIPLLQGLSPAARAIGAVNTIIRVSSSRLIGDNTDWIGIEKPLSSALGQRKRGSALVVGAGGTARAACYALRQMGFERVAVFNRTLAKARALAEEFGCVAVESLDGFRCDAIVATLPPTAGYTAPASLLDGRPVVMDVAYLPETTPLRQQAVAAGCATVAGIEMLLHQGYAAQRLWTMQEPRADVMEAITRPEYQRVAADPTSTTIARQPPPGPFAAAVARHISTV